jgi:prepilin-type processing-associated H-X9-DG protein
MGQYLFGHENHSTGANIFFFDEQKGTAVLKLFWGNVFWGNVTKGI